jgi:hypothetical protein
VAQKSEQQASTQAQAAIGTHGIWWIVPSVIGSCLLGIIFAYLHIRMGGMPIPQAVGLAAANIAVFLTIYSILKRIQPNQDDHSIVALVLSIVVAIPIFVLAFIGLGYELSYLADIGAMYILGAWIGSAEAAERN